MGLKMSPGRTKIIQISKKFKSSAVGSVAGSGKQGLGFDKDPIHI